MYGMTFGSLSIAPKEEDLWHTNQTFSRPPTDRSQRRP